MFRKGDYLKSVKRCDSALRLISRHGLLDECKAMQPLLYRIRDDLTSYDMDRIVKGNRSIEKILGYTEPLYQILPLKDKNDKPMEERLERSLGVLADDARESLKRCKQYRVDQASIDAIDHGWYIIMDTITVELQYRDDPNILGGDGWHNYKQRWRETIRKACNLTRKCLQDDYIQYYAELEWGERGDNPHVHVLWYCKDIPESWKIDPNTCKKLPTNREIANAKSLWDYGICTPVAVRWGFNDCWSKLGWTWPCDDDGIPTPVTNSKGAGLYIAKYTQQESGQWRTRTRMSRNLGMRHLKNSLKNVSTRHLRALSELHQIPMWEKKWRDRVRIPTRLITACAKQERISRAWESKPMLIASLHFRRKSRNITWELSKNLSRTQTEPTFTVCRNWLYEAIRQDTTVYDRRATNAIKELIRELRRFRDEPLLKGLGGRSNATI